MAKTFKALRENAKISQQNLAKALKIKQSTISMWETGNSKPKLAMLPKLAKVFNVSIDEIFNCFK